MPVEEFATAFIGALAQDDLTTHGNLAAYLARDQSHRSGDEADIVDRLVTQRLLAALGYAKSEVKYNQQERSLRPDFIVRIGEYPNRACFVVEDKATTERALETHRGQLTSYMAASQAPRGLLVNGAELLGFDNLGAEPVPTLRLGLASLVRLWRGEDLLARGRRGWAALPAGERDLLGVLLRRYGREAFARVSELVDDLVLTLDGTPHAADGSTWRNGVARLRIEDAQQRPDRLVHAVRDLIADVQADVAAQYDAHMADYARFQEEAGRIPGSAKTVAETIAEFRRDAVSLLPAATDPGERRAFETRFVDALHGALPLDAFDGLEATLRRAANGRGASSAASARSDPAAVLFRNARRFAQRYALHVQRARDRHRQAVAVAEAFQRWRAGVSAVMLPLGDEPRLRREYFAQTAYLVLVRMLLVRVFEDKGLVDRVFTNGGAALWFRQVEPRYFQHALGGGTGRLMEIAYENARQTYAHFYGEHAVFDWYAPDRNTVVRVLHRLARFDLSRVDRDIIGTVYGNYVDEEHKHETGLYYTPPTVVGHILDRIGYDGDHVLGTRLLDPACGSGAFLVEAMRRLVAAQRAYWRGRGHADIPPEHVQAVLDELGNALHGLDLNPFACALAEINLLIQVLDLIAAARRAGYAARVERFRIHVTDAHMHLPETQAALNDIGFPAEDLPEPEQVKTGTGAFAEGYDFVVGNPPYVRADEGAEGLEQYREAIKTGHAISAVRDVLTRKWDMFVPFVALGVHVLRRPGGRLGMIVSNAVETVPYAARLREMLIARTRVLNVDFFEPGVRLFPDAAVANTILIVEAGEPGESHAVQRAWHGGPPPAPVRRQALPQAPYGVEAFRPALPTHQVRAGAEAAPLREIFYISVGMVLNAHERRAPGAFRLDDLLRTHPDATHPVPYVGSEDIEAFAPGRIAYLEYGTDRVPGLIRRPTFPELYDREKLMVGEFGGFLHDDGLFAPEGFLRCNHSVFVLLPWHALAGVENRQIEDKFGDIPRERRARARLERASRAYPLPFMAGLFNSEVWRAVLAGRARSSIARRAQPDDYADQPVPRPDPTLAAAVGAEADAARTAGRALLERRRQGWTRRRDGHWEAPTNAVVVTMPLAPFAAARAAWGLEVARATARCDRLARAGRDLFDGRQPALRLPEAVPEEAAEFLCRRLREAPSGTTLAAIETQGFAIPSRADAAARVMVALRALEAEADALTAEIQRRRETIEALVAPLFEAIPHPPVEELRPALAAT